MVHGTGIKIPLLLTKYTNYCKFLYVFASEYTHLVKKHIEPDDPWYPFLFKKKRFFYKMKWELIVYYVPEIEG